MKMLRVKQKKGNELLLNPAFIVSMEQDFFSTKVIVYEPNSIPKIYIISDGIDLIEHNLAPIKMLRLKTKEKELLLNPAFIISAEREFDSTKIILSCPDSYSGLLSFNVGAGVVLIEEKLASIQKSDQ